jgi:hypothetical protein
MALPVLTAVDLPVVVSRPDGCFDPLVTDRLPNVTRGSAPGPRGWNQAVPALLGS